MRATRALQQKLRATRPKCATGVSTSSGHERRTKILDETMSLYLLIGILKFLGAAVTGVLGVYGLFGKYTKRNGGLTPNGKRMLVAIGLSSAVALGASLAESFEAKSDAAEQVARAERTCRDLSRALQPITQAKISYTLEFPRNNPIVRSYVDYLIRELGPQLKPLQEHQFEAKFKRPEDTSILSEDLNGDPLTIDIGPKSLFWPKRKLRGNVECRASSSHQSIYRKDADCAANRCDPWSHLAYMILLLWHFRTPIKAGYN